MPDTNIRVEFPALWQAAQDIDIAVGTMNSNLDDLEKSLNIKFAPWQGDANNSYNVAKTKWNAAAGEIERLLTSISNAVRASNERMAATEMRNATRFEG